METLHFSVRINAPREKVWDTMLSNETYRTWTRPFGEHSRFEGSWEEGSKILFIGSAENEERMGMVARIKENRRPEFMSIEHLGFLRGDVEDTTSEEVLAWAPAYENYTFTEVDGVTEVSVSIDTDPQYDEMYRDLWPKSLEILKEIAEQA